MITWWVELGAMKGCFVGNEKKKKGGSQHLSEGRIERTESGFPSAGGSWASPFCRELWGEGIHVPWVLCAEGAVCHGHCTPRLCAGVGLGGGGLTRPKKCAAAHLCSSIHSHDAIHWVSFLEFVFVLILFFFFCFSSSSTECFPAQSPRAELSLHPSTAVPSHSGCFLNRNPTEAASRFCILKSGNLLSDSLQISFISCVYYYMCCFQSTTRMETCSIFNLNMFSGFLCCRQNLLK